MLQNAETILGCPGTFETRLGLRLEFHCQFIETLNVSYVLYVVDANYELHCCIVNL